MGLSQMLLFHSISSGVDEILNEDDDDDEEDAIDDDMDIPHLVLCQFDKVIMTSVFHSYITMVGLKLII